MSDPRNDWKGALRPTTDCISIERLDDLTPDELEHVASCPRCSAEMALWEGFRDDERRAEDEEDVRWIGDRLRANQQQREAPPSNVMRWNFRPRMLAVAATVLLAVGIGVIVQRREPSIDVPITHTDLYRSARVEGLAPAGDIRVAPAELRWMPVPAAQRYEVEVLEVDRTPLWRSATTEARVSLPPGVIAQFVPGKTVVWQVKALRGSSVVAESGLQRFRLRPK